MWVRGHSRLLKLVPFESLGAISYLPSIVTMPVFVAVCEIFSVKEWRDLENQVGGRSRSLKMASFDRPYATFYESVIVNIALSCTIFELFDVEYYRDLEIWVRGHSRSLKLVPFESIGTVSYSPSVITMAESVAVCEIFSARDYSVTLKTGLGFVQGHWKWHHLIDRIRVSIRLVWRYLVSSVRYSDLWSKIPKFIYPTCI